MLTAFILLVASCSGDASIALPESATWFPGQWTTPSNEVYYFSTPDKGGIGKLTVVEDRGRTLKYSYHLKEGSSNVVRFTWTIPTMDKPIDAMLTLDATKEKAHFSFTINGLTSKYELNKISEKEQP